MKSILLTGGAGFIGSYICESLIKKGYYVICCDNFYTGNRENLTEIVSHKNFELIRHDITFPIYLEVDEIYNFACPASPVHYQDDPVQTIKTCVHGAINMLGLAKRTKAKIIQASTSEIYGNPTISPQNEKYRGNVKRRLRILQSAQALASPPEAGDIVTDGAGKKIGTVLRVALKPDALCVVQSVLDVSATEPFYCNDNSDKLVAINS